MGETKWYDKLAIKDIRRFVYRRPAPLEVILRI